MLVVTPGPAAADETEARNPPRWRLNTTYSLQGALVSYPLFSVSRNLSSTGSGRNTQFSGFGVTPTGEPPLNEEMHDTKLNEPT